MGNYWSGSQVVACSAVQRQALSWERSPLKPLNLGVIYQHVKGVRAPSDWDCSRLTRPQVEGRELIYTWWWKEALFVICVNTDALELGDTHLEVEVSCPLNTTGTFFWGEGGLKTLLKGPAWMWLCCQAWDLNQQPSNHRHIDPTYWATHHSHTLCMYMHGSKIYVYVCMYVYKVFLNCQPLFFYICNVQEREKMFLNFPLSFVPLVGTS